MAFWSNKEERSSPPQEEKALDEDVIDSDLLIQGFPHMKGFTGPMMTREMAMAIPAFAACVDTIAGDMATLPIKLYERKNGEVVQLDDDPRVQMLNGDTGDLLTGPEMIRAMVTDYFCARQGGNMFIYRTPGSNRIQSLHYVKSDDVCPLQNREYDPIFKQCAYLIGGHTYEPWNLVRILRNTRDGRTGCSIIEQNDAALFVAYQTIGFEGTLVSNSGRKSGFLKTGRSLGKKALAALKAAWRKFYSSSETSVVILNDGVEFQEASASSTELQLNENKQTNSNDIFAMFKIPPEVIRTGKTDNATKNANANYVKHCLMSLIADFVAAFNASLLLESEKATKTFGFDLSEFTKADLKERWEAWGIARDHGFVMPDEVRDRENLPRLGMDYLSLNLRDVLYDINKKKIIVPNNGRVVDLKNLEPGGAPSVEEKAPEPGGEAPEGTEGGEMHADQNQ